jgi:biopolymer transport protein ExbB
MLGGWGLGGRGRGRFWTRLGQVVLVLLLASPSPVLAEEAAAAQDAQQLDEPAVEPHIPSRNLLQVLRAGGVLMLPLVFCSFLLVVFALERFFALRCARVAPAPFVKRLLHQLAEGQLDRETARKLCGETHCAVADVFAAGLKKWGRPAVEVEQAVLDAGERAVNDLRKHLRIFNGVATLSPLLGLLGTVVGMIRSFNAIAGADAMGRPELLAGGISEALITTAAGLSLAIPALALYLFFISRVDQLTMELDERGRQLVELISAEGLQARPSGRNVKVVRQEAA